MRWPTNRANNKTATSNKNNEVETSVEKVAATTVNSSKEHVLGLHLLHNTEKQPVGTAKTDQITGGNSEQNNNNNQKAARRKVAVQRKYGKRNLRKKINKRKITTSSLLAALRFSTKGSCATTVAAIAHRPSRSKGKRNNFNDDDGNRERERESEESDVGKR